MFACTEQNNKIIVYKLHSQNIWNSMIYNMCEESGSRRRLSRSRHWPPLQAELISSKKKKISERRGFRFYQIWGDSKTEEIHLRPGCDGPHQSGARRECREWREWVSDHRSSFFDVLNDRSANHSVPLTPLAAREVKNSQFRAEILPCSVLSTLNVSPANNRSNRQHITL